MVESQGKVSKKVILKRILSGSPVIKVDKTRLKFIYPDASILNRGSINFINVIKPFMRQSQQKSSAFLVC